MDASRALQLLTDLAYFALGIAAIAAAVRSHQRARVDVAVLFGSLGLAVVLQEVGLLTCTTSAGCVSVPLTQTLSTILILIVPFALLRLVDDVADLPRWQLWVSLVALIALGVGMLLGGSAPPPWFVLL